MAEKISIQIALEGGAEVQRQLEGIGEAGKKGFEDLAKAAEKVGGFQNLKTEEITTQLKAAGVEGKALSQTLQAVQTAVKFETLVTGVQSVETAFVALGRAAGPIGAAIAAGLAAAVKATISFAAEVGQLNEQATKLGLTIEQFDRMRQTFEQLGVSAKGVGSGIAAFSNALEQGNIDNVNRAFKELQDAMARGFGAQGTEQLKVLEEAAQGTGKAADLAAQKLEALGLAVPSDTIAQKFKEITASIAGLSRADAAAAVIRSLQAIQDPAQQAALAMKFFGDQAGAELAQKLQTGAASASVFKSAVGNLITAEDAAKADQLNSALNRLSAMWSRFGTVGGAPAMAGVIDATTNSVNALDGALKRLDWSPIGLGARFALSPIGTMIELIRSMLGGIGQQAAQAGQALQQTGVAGQQAGQQAAQGLQLIINPLTGLPQYVSTANQSLAQIGQTGQQAGQQAAAGLQLIINPLTGLPQYVNTANQALGQTGQAGQQAGQQAAQGLQLITDPLTGLPQYVNTANQALAQTGAAAQQAGQQSGQAIQQTNDKINDFITTVGRITWDTISGLGVSAWNALTSAIGDAATAVTNFFSKLASGAWDKVQQLLGLGGGGGGGGGTVPAKASGGLLGGRGTGTSDSNLAWVSRGEYIMPARAVAQPGVLALLEALRRSGGIGRFAQGGLIPAFADGGFFDEAFRVFKPNLLEVVLAIAEAVKAQMETLINLMNLNIGSNARGGLLGGRGTGTSDSNLAWVSRGEYITPARAVAQPGVLAFLEALRRSGGDLSRVLDGMGRFALGGMVPRAIPAFADGGLVGGTRNLGTLRLVMPDGTMVSGLTDSKIAEALGRVAVTSMVRSGGRKPSRYS